MRESEARINLAASVANLGLWLWKIPGDKLWVTEQWRMLFGFADLEPVTFDRLLQAVHPGDRERMKQLVQHMFEHGGEYESEYRITRPDGSTRWIAGHGSVALDELGKPAFARGVSRDVTRRKHGEEALLESEARFRTMADTAPVLMWVSGEDTLCTYVNKAWLEFTGRSMEENLGNGWSEALHPDDVEKALQTYSSAFDAREPFVMQYRLKRHDGEYRRITDQGVPRYGPRGNFRGYVGACVDITDLLEKERALHEFEERVVLAAEATHHGVWELDTTTNELWMSDKARSLFQFDPHACLDETMHQRRVHPDDRALRESAVKHAIETQGDYAIEYRVLLPDGTLRWISGRGRCVAGKDGKGERLIGVSVDITQHKEAQDLFRLAAEGSRLGVWHWDEVAKTLTWDGATRRRPRPSARSPSRCRDRSSRRRISRTCRGRSPRCRTCSGRWIACSSDATRDGGGAAGVASCRCQALAGEPVSLAATLAIAAAYAVFIDGRWRDVRGVAHDGGRHRRRRAAVRHPVRAAGRGRPRLDALDDDDGDFWAFHPLRAPRAARAALLRRLLQLEPARAGVDGRAQQRARSVLLHDVRRRADRAARGGRDRSPGGRGRGSGRSSIVACAVASLGPHTPIYPVLQALLPPLRTFRFPVKYLSLAALGLATLAAMALQWLIDGQRAAPCRRGSC